MINPARRLSIRRTFLRILKSAGNWAVEEETLWSHVDDLVKPPTTLGERGVTLQFLRDGGFIRAAEATLDPDMKEWLLTELGKNLLASL